MLHTVIYSTASFNHGTLTAIDVLSGDPLFFADTSGKTYTPGRDVSLMAAFAGGTGLLQARIEAPSMLRVGYQCIVPIESAASASGDIGMATYADRPIRLVNGEGITVKAANGSAGPVAACLICGFDMVKVPPFALPLLAPGLMLPQDWVSDLANWENYWSTGSSAPGATYGVWGLESDAAVAVDPLLLIASRILYYHTHELFPPNPAPTAAALSLLATFQP